MDLIFFGIQGSGKGTQAKKFCKEFGYDLFEAGGELRKMAASRTELGDTVKSYIDQGNLVPFEIIIQVLEQAVKARPTTQKILFDGIPRDLDQKREFDLIMKGVGRDFRCVHLAVNEEDAVQRILKRASIEGRADDASEDSIRRRMQLFHEKTEPVIDAYRAEENVVDVDGEGRVEDVYGRLKKAVIH